MKIRQPFVALFVPICLQVALIGGTLAQGYPSRVVRYLVPESAGSGNDVIGRIVAAGLTEQFGQQVIVDNRAGASGRIGAEIAAKAPADGYTILHISSALTANISLYKTLPYDLVNDFAPITHLVFSPALVSVHPSLPVKSIPDLIALAKTKPGAINYASAGTGSRSFVDAALFSSMAGINMVHVPYKGGGEAIAAVLAGEMHLMFTPVATAISHVKAGQLRALAVSTANRLPLLPELPTIAEAGVAGYSSSNWFGLVVPAKTPKDVINSIHRAVIATLRKPDVIKRINDLGCIIVGNQPEEFAAFINSDIALLADVFKRAGVTAN
jgi:tripartite-type tricarboxylate transporter receptor subunit TctC